jgi:hypothetical protein
MKNETELLNRFRIMEITKLDLEKELNQKTRKSKSQNLLRFIKRML